MPLEAADAGQGYDESLDFAGPHVRLTASPIYAVNYPNKDSAIYPHAWQMFSDYT